MDKVILKAKNRELVGRKVKQLRKQGELPGNVYGKKVKSQSISIDAKDFEKVFKKVGETGLVELVVGGKTSPVLIHEVQSHPVTDEYLHVDFLQVNLKEKVKAQIPVEMIGDSPAEKSGIGTAVQYLDEVEVEALPGDLVEKFEIDATTLIDLESAIQISDLKYDKSKITIFNESDQIIAKLEPPQKEEEVEVAPVATDEAEVEGTEDKKEVKDEQSETEASKEE